MFVPPKTSFFFFYLFLGFLTSAPQGAASHQHSSLLKGATKKGFGKQALYFYPVTPPKELRDAIIMGVFCQWISLENHNSFLTKSEKQYSHISFI